MSTPEEHTSKSQPFSTPFTSKFNDVVEKSMQKWHIPGIAIAILKGDDTFSKGYGVSVQPSTPVTPNTLFYTGSTTKAFTCAAYSLLLDPTSSLHQPNLSWSTPIYQLLSSDFVLTDDYWTTHTTVEDYLCHRAGLPRHDKSYGGSGCKRPRDVVRSLRHLPFRPDAEPRSSWEYCNLGYVAVSCAIEEVTRTGLGEVMKEGIWDRLGMEETFWGLEDVEKKGSMGSMSKGYQFYHGKGEGGEEGKFVEVEWMDLRVVSGGGCMISNVLDYSKWIRAMMRKEGPVSKEQNEKMTKPIIPLEFGLPETFPGVTYGLGWFITWYHGEKIVWHPGGLRGFSCVMAYIPSRDWGCIMMANTTNFAFGQEVIMWWLVDELLEVPIEKRIDWDEKNEKMIKNQDEAFENARTRLYPDAAALAHSLSLEMYTGKYSHPAYQSLAFNIKDGKLYADVSNRTWPFTVTLEHVSGEHFLALIQNPYPFLRQQDATRAEFRIGANGKVKSLGMIFEPDPKSAVIWFERGLTG